MLDLLTLLAGLAKLCAWLYAFFMHIAIDARALRWAGIGRYIKNVLVQYNRLPSPHQFTVLLPAGAVAEYEHLGLGSRFSTSIVDDTYYSWREQLLLWQQLSAVEADLWHFTHFNVPLLFTRPFVVTVHDVTRFIFPGQRHQRLARQVAYEQLFARTIKRARGVITVSEVTRQELAALPVAANQTLTTIHEGVDDRYFTPPSTIERTKVRMLLGTHNPYLLHVGVWMSHKNLERLLEAHAQLIKTRPGLKLVITGRPKPGYHNLLPVAKRLGTEQHVIFSGFVPEPLLPALYAEARCFVFPSLYEGFGLPALEAAACGTPVVAANTSSLPEVMGSAAQYINPEHVPSLIAGIDRVLRDQQWRAYLVAAGQARAARFRWDLTARHHLSFYERAHLATPAPRQSFA